MSPRMAAYRQVNCWTGTCTSITRIRPGASGAAASGGAGAHRRRLIGTRNRQVGIARLRASAYVVALSRPLEQHRIK